MSRNDRRQEIPHRERDTYMCRDQQATRRPTTPRRALSVGRVTCSRWGHICCGYAGWPRRARVGGGPGGPPARPRRVGTQHEWVGWPFALSKLRHLCARESDALDFGGPAPQAELALHLARAVGEQLVRLRPAAACDATLRGGGRHDGEHAVDARRTHKSRCSSSGALYVPGSITSRTSG